MEGAGGEGSNLARPVLRHADSDEALIELLARGIPGTGMPAIWALDEAQRMSVAAYVRSLGQRDAELMPGDPARGAELYRTSGGCPACHIADGFGNGIGPELSAIGDARGRDYLEQSLLDPAAAQPMDGGSREFLTVRLRTADGAVEGMRVNEDEFSIQVRDIGGALHSFQKDELLEFEKVFAHSLMPSFGDSMTDDDIADLVSFLMSLRSGP